MVRITDIETENSIISCNMRNEKYICFRKRSGIMAEDWARATLKEVPFWRDGMSVEEYERERDYLNLHLEDLKNGKYIPLWKQEKPQSE